MHVTHAQNINVRKQNEWAKKKNCFFPCSCRNLYALLWCCTLYIALETSSRYYSMSYNCCCCCWSCLSRNVFNFESLSFSESPVFFFTYFVFVECQIWFHAFTTIIIFSRDRIHLMHFYYHFFFLFHFKYEITETTTVHHSQSQTMYVYYILGKTGQICMCVCARDSIEEKEQSFYFSLEILFSALLSNQ